MAESREPSSKATPPAQSDTEQWIFTVRRSTGELVKVERADDAAGERTEMPVHEYLAQYQAQAGASSSGAGYSATAAPYAGYPYDPYTAYYWAYLLSAYPPYGPPW